MEVLNYVNEIKSLRSLVVRLAGEIDYKNLMLMEKDEKNANLLESLMEEKRLLDEKTGVINGLAEKKEQLLRNKSAIMIILTEKQQKLEESSKLMSLLIAQNTKKDVLIEEKERLFNETSESLNILKGEKEKLVNDKDAEICTLMVQHADKERLIDEISDAYLKESLKIHKMKLEIEKLQLDFESKTEELELVKKDQNKMVQETVAAEPPKIEPEQKPEEQQISALINTEQNKIQEVEELRAQVNELKTEMEEKEEALRNMEMDNQTLMIKELRSNHELQAARRSAVESFQAIPRNRANIGIKIIGEVNQKPFRDACSKRFSDGNWADEFGDWEEKSLELCSLWQENISDPGWQPFKHQNINGKLTEGIDENDQSLKELREEWGEEAYKAVVEALLGVNEYNASGRYPISELWNFKEDRRATLGEVMQFVIKKWRIYKKK